MIVCSENENTNLLLWWWGNLSKQFVDRTDLLYAVQFEITKIRHTNRDELEDKSDLWGLQNSLRSTREHHLFILEFQKYVSHAWMTALWWCFHFSNSSRSYIRSKFESTWYLLLFFFKSLSIATHTKRCTCVLVWVIFWMCKYIARVYTKRSTHRYYRMFDEVSVIERRLVLARIWNGLKSSAFLFTPSSVYSFEDEARRKICYVSKKLDWGLISFVMYLSTCVDVGVILFSSHRKMIEKSHTRSAETRFVQDEEESAKRQDVSSFRTMPSVFIVWAIRSAWSFSVICRESEDEVDAKIEKSTIPCLILLLESSDLKTRSLDTLLLEVETFLHIEHTHQSHNPRHIEMSCFVKMNNVKSRQPFEAMPFYAMPLHTLEQSEHNRFQSSFDAMMVFDPRPHKREARETRSWLFLLPQWVQVLWRIESMLYHLQVRNLHTLVSVLILALRSRRQIWRRVSQHMHHFRHTSREIFSQTIPFVVSTASVSSTRTFLVTIKQVTIGVLRSKLASLGLSVLEIRKSRPETRERIISSPIHLDRVFLVTTRGQERFV